MTEDNDNYLLCGDCGIRDETIAVIDWSQPSTTRVTLNIATPGGQLQTGAGPTGGPTLPAHYEFTKNQFANAQVTDLAGVIKAAQAGQAGRVGGAGSAG